MGSLDTFIGDMEVQGLAVNYLSPMQPAENVSGSAKFNKRTFEVTLKGGRLPGLSLKSGNLLFTGLDQQDQFLDMDLTVNGPFKSALEFMDSEPLGFAKAVNFQPDGVTARPTRVKLGFLVERATSAEMWRFPPRRLWKISRSLTSLSVIPSRLAISI